MTPIEKVAYDLDTFGRDCVLTVALKITDDSCKMDDEQRALFMALYDALPSHKSEIFNDDVYTLIAEGRSAPNAELFERIKKEREMAMAIITQERMKIFKASVRGSLIIAERTLR